MAVKCASCGAGIEPGQKFCSHCGTAIPDDTFRAEIRIDDTAEIRRAKYEEQESELRRLKMARELRTYKVARRLMAICACISALSIVLAFTVFYNTNVCFLMIELFFILGAVAVMLFIKTTFKK